MTNLPLPLENGIFVTNFQTKADIFNDFFLYNNTDIISNSVLADLLSKCNDRLDDIEIDPAKVLTIIRSSDQNKAHGWDNLSISMIKICDAAIVNPLCFIYEKWMSAETFPQIWKRAHFLPIHNKESRQMKKNCRPISMLPVCGKIFEKVIFDAIYTHFTS